MFFRSIFTIAVLISLVGIIFVQSEQGSSLSSNRFQRKFPSMTGEEALQWLATHGSPHRWHSAHSGHQANDVARLLKMLRELDDHGIREFTSKNFEGVSMEVIFEAASKSS